MLCRKITVLENSIYYFLESVFIDIQKGGCRLIVTHQNHVLTDCTYKSIRAAKIAFSRMYREKAWEDGVKTIWTLPYLPDDDWLVKKLPENFAGSGR